MRASLLGRHPVRRRSSPPAPRPSAGWTYAPAPSKTPGAQRLRLRLGRAERLRQPEPRGRSARPAIKFEQTTRRRAPAGTPFQIEFDNKDAGVPHNVVDPRAASTGAEVFKGDDLQRRRDPDLRRPGARRRRLRVRLHGPSDHDRDAHRPVTPRSGMTPTGEQLCYTDAYARSRRGARRGRRRPARRPLVVLDRTVFYPGGGGQPSDRGLLLRAGRRPVLDGPRRRARSAARSSTSSSPTTATRRRSATSSGSTSTGRAGSR